MNAFRRYALVFISLSAAVALACGDYGSPTDPARIARSDVGTSNVLPDIYVTAPYTYYCTGQYGLSIPCENSDGEYIANLNQFQISAYCNDEETSYYCNFDRGGGGGFDDASPYHIDDFNDSGTLPPEPDCGSYQPNEMVQVWCAAPAPAAGSMRRQKIVAAINRIKLLGQTDGLCAEFATEAERLLANNLIRVYPANDLRGRGGFAPPNQIGNANAYMGLSSEYVDLGFDNHAKTILGNRITLQLILAHELDHLKSGSAHIANTVVGQMFTANTSRCSGEGPPVNVNQS